MSHILLATNSKTGIFRTFPTEERKFVTFKTGFLGGPAVIKVTTMVKLHVGNELGFPHAALFCKCKGYDFCAVDKNDSVSATFWK